MSESTKGFLVSGFIAFVAIAAMIRETMVEGEPGLAMGIAALMIVGFLLALDVAKEFNEDFR